jgi:hypothetical protein
MDKECQRFGANRNADADDALETRGVMVTLFVLMSFSTLLLTTLTEHFSHLPTTLVALAAAWWVLRL